VQLCARCSSLDTERIGPEWKRFVTDPLLPVTKTVVPLPQSPDVSGDEQQVTLLLEGAIGAGDESMWQGLTP
jgi:hypothetical protein